MRVLGAGLPRAATTTQMIALETLGFGPCYHMRDLLGDMEGQLPLWEAVMEGRPDWEAIVGKAQSTADWPASRFYKELLEIYPDAKVMLNVRGAEGWARACARPSGRSTSANRSCATSAPCASRSIRSGGATSTC